MTTHARTTRLRLAIGAIMLTVAGLMAALLLQYVRAANTDQPEASLSAAERPLTAPAAQPAARPRRLALIVIDGLRDDTAATLPTWRALAAQGVRARAQAPLPSLSRPSYAVTVSGTEPGRTGIRTNGFAFPVGVDTILDRAHEAKMAVHGVGSCAFWGENFGPAFTRWREVSSEKLVEAAARELKQGAEVLIVHIVAVDKAGHNHGGGSPQYQEAAQEASDQLQAIVSNLDLTQDAVIVLADHGHRARGGHGGPEAEVLTAPVLMAGRGVLARGEVAELGSLGRLAPTIALMMGLPYPRDLSLRPWTEALDPALYPETYLQARLKEWRQHREDYERRWLKSVYEAWTSQSWDGEVVGNRVSSATVVPWDAGLEVLAEARAQTLEEIQRDRRVARTPAIALVIVPLLLMLIVGALRGYGLAPALAAPLLGGVTVASHLATGHPLSLSAITTHHGYLLGVGLCFLTALVVYLGALAGLLRTVAPEYRRDALRFHLTAAALLHVALPFFLWLLSGFSLDAPLPSPTLTYLPILSSTVAGMACTAAGLVWLQAAWSGRRGIATQDVTT